MVKKVPPDFNDNSSGLGRRKGATTRLAFSLRVAGHVGEFRCGTKRRKGSPDAEACPECKRACFLELDVPVAYFTEGHSTVARSMHG